MQKKINPEKIVGIVGGMGPYATVDFFKQILDLTAAKKEWEHIRLLIDNNVKIPSRTRALLYGEASPSPAMIDSINNLARAGADFVVVPCNSVHYFYDEIVKQSKIPWINLIEIASEAVTKLKKTRPLVLGGYATVGKKMYSRYLPEAQYLSAAGNKFVMTVIEEIKLKGKLSVSKKKRLDKMIIAKKTAIDSVILACTELPIVYNKKVLSGIPIVDANLEYAKKTVQLAKNWI